MANSTHFLKWFCVIVKYSITLLLLEVACSLPVHVSCMTCQPHISWFLKWAPLSGLQSDQNKSSKSEKPETVDGICLQLKDKNGRANSHERGSSAMIFLNISRTMNSHFALFAVSWCSIVENTCDIPSMPKPHISWFLRWVLLSDLITQGISFLAKTSISALATLLAVALERSMNSGQWVVYSTIIRTNLFPKEDLGLIGPITSKMIMSIYLACGLSIIGTSIKGSLSAFLITAAFDMLGIIIHMPEHRVLLSANRTLCLSANLWLFRLQSIAFPSLKKSNFDPT